tara:strand:- start:1558 stop:2466 length:909 start_codon:yes stop_codon:yes gene_type:complete
MYIKNWIKKGNIFNLHRAQLPVVDIINTQFKIYFSNRNKLGKSFPMSVIFDAESKKILGKPIKLDLELGKPGSFDWSGIMPTDIVTTDVGSKYLYYIGWSRRIDVPYHNNLGLAVSYDKGENWEKYSNGPIFHTNNVETGYIGTVDILIEDGLWKMWYLSCRDWFEHEGVMEPIYDIKYATSKNGINWIPSNKICIPLINDEGGISAARVIKKDDLYHMWFSVRNKINYRTNRTDSYRIKKATSNDGVNWIRETQNEIEPSDDYWENFMVCYPDIIKYKKQYYMFYNGNGFGESGFGYAELE